ncbi:MmcQ/YjbR family DNA-binding protein [Chitinimonas arctica]|uniref:MmcQ/YjbR family DNA-binding protein n=1 Tax=Chitinimonas arctica TaxID=2594795 RepID=A0A516SEN5_9NEIS|nr:MmcQ/YjbR family DNA-binding protein [Chitinimonas arctica]QDQ26622.1 MmcQ/YjbR family DNA-binding protein [Chitinimonas arctica]
MTHAEIEAFCLALPGVSADIKWDCARVFSVHDKMFCLIHMDAAQSTGPSFKVDPQRFLEMTDQPGFIPAPYLARHHWVKLTDMDAIAAPHLADLLRTSYQLVRAKLPKKQRDALPAL